MCSLTVPEKDMISRNTPADGLFCFGPLKLIPSDYSYVLKYIAENFDNRLVPEEEGRGIISFFFTYEGPSKQTEKTKYKFLLNLECI